MRENKAKPRRIHFTKEALAKLKPPVEGRDYVYDDKVRGLALCTTAAGAQAFYLYRKVDGKPERIRLGGWPELTIEQARRAAASYNGKIAEGQNPASTYRVKRQAPTLGTVFDLFIELPTRTKAKRPKSELTVRNYRQVWNTCLEPWRHRKLSTISKGDVERLHNTIGTERGKFTANRALELVRALFNCAIDEDAFNTNPAARLSKFEEESRTRRLEETELPRFWKALEAEPSEKIKDFIKISLFTGQRRSNCLRMRWDEIDFERAVWTMAKTKTGRHEVPLTGETTKILKRRHAVRGDSDFVFPGRHGAGHLQDPMRQWRAILAAAGIENLRIHDLRRSLGSWQADTGASLQIIGRSLGHSRPETTAIYSRLSDAPVRQAMESATAAILAATTEKPAKKSFATKGAAKSRKAKGGRDGKAK